MQDIVFGVEQEVDFIAASFVRKASDILEIRQLLQESEATHIQIISKKLKTKKVLITLMRFWKYRMV
ncbi:hypothetical protein GCM10020331_009820 [Ectobacillus funiculus]